MRDIKGFEGLYAATEEGQIWSYKSQKFLKPADNGCGYLMVGLRKNGERHPKKIHRLIAETFLPNPEELSDVNHKDQNKYNNSVDNLEWCSRSYNIKYSSQAGKPKLFTKIRCVETGEIYPDQEAAGAAVNRTSQGINNCLQGKQRTCAGYHWERVYDEI